LLSRFSLRGLAHRLDLKVPGNITLIPLPPPELNSLEPDWLYLRDRSLSLRLLPDYGSVVEAACSLCACPWIEQVIS
jgi:hypothetical protein